MPPEMLLTSDSDMELTAGNFKDTAKRRNSTGPKYFCGTEGCSASFLRLDQLDRHEYHHTGVRKHHCSYDDCEKSYTILTHLKRHLRTTHERTVAPMKSVPCILDGCDKMFQSTCNMQRHIREVHENPKVYHCAHCDEKFTQKLKMRRHEIVKHTLDYPYRCEKCTKGFYQRWHYDRHTPVCKVYPCPNCALQFDKWSLYQQHCRETQHGRQYYKCEYCARIYGKPSELQRHTAAKHLTCEAEQNMAFKCTYDGCERKYTYERNLRQHISTAHTGKRFDCSECTRGFSSSQNLTKHIDREHGTTIKIATVKSKPVGKRKKRKDAGKSKLSHLAKLSGLAVDKRFDELLRERETDALNALAKVLLKSSEQTPDERVLSSEGEETAAVLPGVVIGDKDEIQLDALLAVALR